MSIDMDIAVAQYTASAPGASQAVLLPDPAPEPIWHPIISVDDHLLEPFDLFAHRLPRQLVQAAPRAVPNDAGTPVWMIDGTPVAVTVTNGAVGRPMSEWNGGPQRFDQFRTGVYDPALRLKDMDLCGIWGSLCFPSIVFGFCGSRLARMKDRELGLACVRAYNDWVIDTWCAAAPDRYIPCQLPWMADPEVAAAEIRRNAARGVRAVTFSENPEIRGFPSIHTGAWDAFFAACAETETVVNLHVGSSGFIESPSQFTPDDARAALFPVNAVKASVDWVYSGVPLRFPSLRIVLSEGGVSWVPMVMERLTRAYRQVESSTRWRASDPSPVDVFRRNFRFTSIEDPAAFRLLDLIGAENVMVECDYPHNDSTWPSIQSLLKRDLGHLQPPDIDLICIGNAVDLYGAQPPTAEWTARTERICEESGGPDIA